jgi:hypothetical protein
MRAVALYTRGGTRVGSLSYHQRYSTSGTRNRSPRTLALVGDLGATKRIYLTEVTFNSGCEVIIIGTTIITNMEAGAFHAIATSNEQCMLIRFSYHYHEPE